MTMDKGDILRYADSRYLRWLKEYADFLRHQETTMQLLLENYEDLTQTFETRNDRAGWIPVPELVTTVQQAKNAIETVQFEITNHITRESKSKRAVLSRLFKRSRGWVPNQEFIAHVNEAKRLMEIVTTQIIQHQKQEIVGVEMAEKYSISSLRMREQQQDDPATQ